MGPPMSVARQEGRTDYADFDCFLHQRSWNSGFIGMVAQRSGPRISTCCPHFRAATVNACIIRREGNTRSDNCLEPGICKKPRTTPGLSILTREIGNLNEGSLYPRGSTTLGAAHS
jgi:hypothetical protein